MRHSQFPTDELTITNRNDEGIHWLVAERTVEYWLEYVSLIDGIVGNQESPRTSLGTTAGQDRGSMVDCKQCRHRSKVKLSVAIPYIWGVPTVCSGSGRVPRAFWI